MKGQEAEVGRTQLSYLKQGHRVSYAPRVNIISKNFNPFLLGKPLKTYFYGKIPYYEDCKCKWSVDQMRGWDKLILGSHYIESLKLKNFTWKLDCNIIGYFMWLICHVLFEALPSAVQQKKIGYKIYKRGTTVVVLTAKEGGGNKVQGHNICTLQGQKSFL